MIVEGMWILRYWGGRKDNSSKYPLLSKVAKDVLAILVSTLASESTFSTGSRIVDPFRSSLSPLMVQNLVCAQNWLQARVPISHRQSRDEVEALEEEFHDLGNIFKFWNLLSINYYWMSHVFKQILKYCIYFLFFSSFKSTIIIKCISKYQLQIGL